MRTAERSDLAHELHWGDFLWALGALCNLRNLPFDGELFVRQFPPPYSIEQLVAVLKALGIPVRGTTTEALRGPMKFPCVAFQRVEKGGPGEPPRKVALIARCDRRQALAINALSRGTFAVPFVLLNEVFEPLVLSLAAA
jgi:hypothetical protein